jgi:hypothetical protein
MDRGDILARLDHERCHLQPEGAVLERLAQVTRLRAADHSHHNVIFSALTAATADAAIAAEIEHHRVLDVSFEWKLYAHDAPGDLLSRLQAAGFEIGDKEAVLIYDLRNRPAWIDASREHPVRRVDRLEEVELFRHAAEKIFSKNHPFIADKLAAAIRARSMLHRAFLALDGDEVVAIGRLYTHPDSLFAGLYGAGTLASHRGRGFYRAVVAARALEALTQGARYLVVDALPTSRPILERLGFEHLTDTWPCEWHPVVRRSDKTTGGEENGK